MSKQRQAFEKEYNKHHPNDMATRLQNGNYSGWVKQASWEMWQQAQKVAVPEGFVLMPLEIDDFDHPITKALEKGIVKDLSTSVIYKAMIEAGEKND